MWNPFKSNGLDDFTYEWLKRGSDGVPGWTDAQIKKYAATIEQGDTRSPMERLTGTPVKWADDILRSSKGEGRKGR